jgi:hypothetical protein
MPIERVDPNLETEDEDLFQEEGDGTEYNMRELMDQVYKLKDCIITVPSDQVPLLKQGLITRKGKDNAKAKSGGLLPDQSVLSFLAYPAKDSKGKELDGITDVRIKLGPKKSVSVLEIRVPSDDL